MQVKYCPMPAHEDARLHMLRDLEAEARSQEDPVLAKLVAMTASVLDAPIAFISIVESERQIFRAQIGLAVESAPRDEAICAHTILEPRLLEVLDTWQDMRFASLPLIVADPELRYYAGYPILSTEGLGLGSLCVADTCPRGAMSEKQAAFLQHMAELVMIRLNNLRSASYIDPPTGLYNRSKLEQDILLSMRAKRATELVAIDVISPKALNDVVKAFGYTFASDMMLAIRDRFLALLPPQHALYKVSPTRFGLLLEAPCDGPLLYQLILDRFSVPLVNDGIPLHMNIGIGVLPIDAQTPPDQDHMRLVVGASDNARAKGLGWTLYQPEIDAAQQRALNLVSALSVAIHSSDQFRLDYQPKVSLRDGRCTGVEALLRWTHPVLGAISPAEFIPLAEKTALIESLSCIVARAAIEQAGAWHRQGLHMPIAINLAAPDLENTRLADLIIGLLAEQALPRGSFSLELTESSLMRSPEVVCSQLHRLRQAGVRIAIDDFGSGYSNWVYLRDLPAEIIKIDRTLVHNLATEEKDQRLVRAIIDLARKTGYTVIAEGIETDIERVLLADWGCDEGQGFLFARPMHADRVVQWLDMQGCDVQVGAQV
ncbi:putative bifunctional diguanylate cyclase/phosphodiesterase [Pseudomonas entomophila]|uniref:putative bifunctional diguanylate cyclase/phosphodiesterase n=1 Tax=Pseudomonas entomophila TaxID=312306 RepID=UPI003EBD8EDB